ncbi:hypothetical protein EBZ80_13700 [bacterium]|nr:hypothetical protein [bacterium]
MLLSQTYNINEKKRADPTNQSAIARFMRDGLDPNREYDRREITTLWESYAPNTGIKSLMRFSVGNSRSYGEIIFHRHDRFFLNTALLDAFHRYF